MTIDWLDLARCDDLVVALDLDGTLVPYAATPAAAVLDEPLFTLLGALQALPRVIVAVVSGRPRAMLAELTARLPAAIVIGEHGAWRAVLGHGEDALAATPELDELVAAWTALIGGAPGALIERKRASVCLHWRAVAAAHRDVLISSAELRAEEWLETQPDFERLDGAETFELRHRAAHKGNALVWLRAHAPVGARVLALGDDVTDEDLFAALGPGDAAVRVGGSLHRTHADAVVGDVTAARALLDWLIAARLGASAAPPGLRPASQRLATHPTVEVELLVVSNRLPAPLTVGRGREVGGLASALEQTLVDRPAVWMGWSGRERDPGLILEYDAAATPPRAAFDYPPGWREAFYTGFCNRALWPLLHCLPSRVRYADDAWRAYVDANTAYARLAGELVGPMATVWAHDYHLFLLARALRKAGHRGRIGLFLHVPFPPRDVFETLPWARQLLGAIAEFDLVGVQTWRAATNLRACFDALGLRQPELTAAVRVFPIGIDPQAFATAAATGDAVDVAALRAEVGPRKLLLGVDRLDYSKGVAERLEAYARLLELYPQWRGQVVLVQVSVPTRADVPEYAELRQRVENLVGRINGAYGEADWVPVRYLYRSYPSEVLAQLYRAADVALVTPMRDGMNLVAKEFVASQDPDDPGVLVLSRFAGAAEELTAAILTNPYHVDGMAVDFDQALRLEPAERVARHRELAAIVWRGTVQVWTHDFLTALAGAPPLAAPAVVDPAT